MGVSRHWMAFLLVPVCFAVLQFPLPSKAEAPAHAAVIRTDVAVFGGTPEGVAAAVGAARAGHRVLLVSPRSRLGGVIVDAGLNTVDMNRGPDGQILNQGIFAEWYRQVEGDSFDLGTAAAAFGRLVEAEPRITLWLNAPLGRTSRLGDRVAGVTVFYEGSPVTVVADRYIDATEDADLAAAAGVPYTTGRQDYTGQTDGQAASLIFRLTGVDWAAALKYLADDGDPYTGATERSLWGFGPIMYRYEAANRRIAMRGLNVGRQNDGSVLVNALWIFGVDPLNPAAREQGKAAAVAELPRVVAYLRANCPGFARAELAGVADDLYIRESRHLRTLYQLTVDDVLENRDQPDAIAQGSYPVDLQATAPGRRVQIVGVPKRYAVPLRSLVPVGTANLLAASRSAGYTSLAAGSARTVQMGMATGQAAGVAAALSMDHLVTVPGLAGTPQLVHLVQAELRRQGVVLEPFREPSPLAGSPYADDVRYFRRMGLVTAGYGNEYGLGEPVTGPFVAELLAGWREVTGRTVRPTGPLPEGAMTVQEGAAALARATGGEAAALLAALPGDVRPGARLNRGQFYRLARSAFSGYNEAR